MTDPSLSEVVLAGDVLRDAIRAWLHGQYADFRNPLYQSLERALDAWERLTPPREAS